jgi:hypothetical protein
MKSEIAPDSGSHSGTALNAPAVLPAVSLLAAPVLLVLLLGTCLALPGAARADDEAVQRALLERQQQSDAFALQLRQFQQSLQATPAQRQSLDSLHLQQRQRFDALNDGQRAALRASPSEIASGVAWGPRLDAALPQLARERQIEMNQ